ncbi:unnamed protein product, partial [Mesorhabditis belari]|uniref:Uncharacterized protein n=1 Tax=Mesorhabditis belari TaxID=2138241 RepID=A0AAF3J4Y9_9BILA
MFLWLLIFLPAICALTNEEIQDFRGLGGRESVFLLAFEKRIANLPMNEQRKAIERYVATIAPHRRESYELFKMQKNKDYVQRMIQLKQKVFGILGREKFSKLMVILHNPKMSREVRLFNANDLIKDVKLIGQKAVIMGWAKDEIPAGIQ